MDERIGGWTEHLGPTTDCQPKVGLSGVTVPQFQQTGGEVGSRRRIFRRESQGAPEGVRGKSNLAVQEKDASERCQDIRAVPRKLLRLQQDCACLAAIVAMYVEVGQIKLQVDTLWCERERVFEDVDCLAKTSIPGKLLGELARLGAAQEFVSLGATPGGVQRFTKKDFDGRIFVAARRLFQRRDRLLASHLSKQSLGQDRHSGGIGPARFQHFRSKLLGLGEMLHPQRKGGAFEQLGARVDVTARYVWHWNRFERVDPVQPLAWRPATRNTHQFSREGHRRIAGTTRFAIVLLGSLPALTAAAAADNLIEAGEWKVTSTGVVNGTTSPPQAKSRCITPEQAGNVAATFGPVSGTVNSDCAAPTIDAAGKTLKWRLQCRGQLDIDAAAEFTFDSPRHYTAVITSKGKMAGALISDVKTDIEAERVGECTQ